MINLNGRLILRSEVHAPRHPLNLDRAGSSYRLRSPPGEGGLVGPRRSAVVSSTGQDRVDAREPPLSTTWPPSRSRAGRSAHVHLPRGCSDARYVSDPEAVTTRWMVISFRVSVPACPSRSRTRTRASRRAERFTRRPSRRAVHPRWRAPRRGPPLVPSGPTAPPRYHSSITSPRRPECDAADIHIVSIVTQRSSAAPRAPWPTGIPPREESARESSLTQRGDHPTSVAMRSRHTAPPSPGDCRPLNPCWCDPERVAPPGSRHLPTGRSHGQRRLPHTQRVAVQAASAPTLSPSESASTSRVPSRGAV